MLTPRLVSQLLTALIVLLALTAAFFTVMLLQARSGVADHQASPTRHTAEAAPASSAESAAQGSAQAQPQTQAQPQVVQTATVTQPAPAPSASSSLPAGLTASGWSDNSTTRCGGGETLRYAGRGGGNWVTVCSSGGSMTYRGNVFDGSLTRAVDAGDSNPGAGQFTVPADPSTIVIDGSNLYVYQGGDVVSNAYFSETYIGG